MVKVEAYYLGLNDLSCYNGVALSYPFYLVKGNIVMKKLYTANGDFVQFIKGEPVIGGKQFILVDKDDPEVLRLAEAGKIKSLDLEFPDNASNIDYKRYLRTNGGDITKSAELYLSDLLSGKSKNPVDVVVTTASKSTGKTKAETKPETKTKVEDKATEPDSESK